MNRLLLSVGLLGLAALLPVHAQAQDSLAEALDKGPPAATLYEGVGLIDGTGSPMQPDMSVLVVGQQIEAVFAAGTAPQELPDNTERVDASHWYAVPGLVDNHVHLATLPNRREAEGMMRRYLYSGITSVRDMAGDTRALADLARAAMTLEIPAPDLHYAALMAGPGFFADPRTAASSQGVEAGAIPWMQAITADTNMSEAVSLARGTSATGIKIYANLAAESVAAIAAEGRRQGIPVWAHTMVFPAYPSQVAAAGVTAMSHVCRIAYETLEERPTEYHHKLKPDYSAIDTQHPAITAVFETMAEHGTVLDPTLRIYWDTERRRAADPEAAAEVPDTCPTDFAAALTARAIELGVEVVPGTDGATAYDNPYPALHEELELLVERVGMTPVQAIRSATLVSARVVGKEAELGSIAPGKRADLVFLAADPSVAIGNLRTVTLTVKRGRPYPRDEYEPLAEDELSPLMNPGN